MSLPNWGAKPQLFNELSAQFFCHRAQSRLAEHDGFSVNHLGTLGTGNHFIEVCLDENENVWFLLHSGSRGVGNRFGTFFIELAKNDMGQWMINLPDQDLAYYGRAFMASLSSTGITPTANAVPSSSPMDGRGLWGCLVPSRLS